MQRGPSSLEECFPSPLHATPWHLSKSPSPESPHSVRNRLQVFAFLTRVSSAPRSHDLCRPPSPPPPRAPARLSWRSEGPDRSVSGGRNRSPLGAPTPPRIGFPSPPSVDAHRRGGREPRIQDVDAAHTARSAHGRQQRGVVVEPQPFAEPVHRGRAVSAHRRRGDRRRHHCCRRHRRPDWASGSGSAPDHTAGPAQRPPGGL